MQYNNGRQIKKIMKIEVTEGCTAFSCYIDNKEISEFSTEDLRKIVHKLVDMCDRDNLESLIWDISELVGEYKYEGHCECCNDSIVNYTVKLD